MVLPLVNMISDRGDDYFTDGMTEELISTISRISEPARDLSDVGNAIQEHRGENN